MGTYTEASVVRQYGAHAALVMGQIRYWLNKAANGRSRFVVERKGQKWAALSRSKLADETGLTVRQVEEALAKLKKGRMILSERGLFDNRVTPHFRAIDHTETGAINCPYVGQSSIYETDIEIKKRLSAGSADAPFSGGLPVVSGRKNLSVSDMLAGARSTEKAAPISPKDARKPGDLEKVFKTAWSDSYEGEYLSPLTGKALGQLKLFAQRCPPDMAGRILDYAVRHWHAFCSLAESRQGAIKPPGRPDIGTLLRFVDSAVEFQKDEEWLAKAAQKPLRAETAPKAPSPPPAPVEALSEADKPVTDLATAWELLGLADKHGKYGDDQ